MTFMNFLMIPHFIEMAILETKEFHSMVCMMLFYIYKCFCFPYPSPFFCYGGGGLYIKVYYKYG